MIEIASAFVKIPSKALLEVVQGCGSSKGTGMTIARNRLDSSAVLASGPATAVAALLLPGCGAYSVSIISCDNGFGAIVAAQRQICLQKVAMVSHDCSGYLLSRHPCLGDAMRILVNLV